MPDAPLNPAQPETSPATVQVTQLLHAVSEGDRAANEQLPVMTRHVQELLLGWYREGEGGLGSGITAMPSMHVAMAFLFWLAVRMVWRPVGWFFLAFFVAIWLGSVPRKTRRVSGSSRWRAKRTCVLASRNARPPFEISPAEKSWRYEPGCTSRTRWCWNAAAGNTSVRSAASSRKGRAHVPHAASVGRRPRASRTPRPLG